MQFEALYRLRLCTHQETSNSKQDLLRFSLVLDTGAQRRRHPIGNNSRNGHNKHKDKYRSKCMASGNKSITVKGQTSRLLRFDT